jgi:2-keto-4-pentenoate hydratase
MIINGEIMGEGIGSDIMQDPYNALAWIANWLSNRKQNLKQGEIIMLGSIVQTQWVSKGDKVEVEIEQLGKTSVIFY